MGRISPMIVVSALVLSALSIGARGGCGGSDDSFSDSSRSRGSGHRSLQVRGTLTGLGTLGTNGFTVFGQAPGAPAPTQGPEAIGGVRVTFNGGTQVRFQDAPFLDETDFAIGQPVRVRGNKNSSDGSLNAEEIRVRRVRVHGPVTGFIRVVGTTLKRFSTFEAGTTIGVTIFGLQCDTVTCPSGGGTIPNDNVRVFAIFPSPVPPGSINFPLGTIIEVKGIYVDDASIAAAFTKDTDKVAESILVFQIEDEDDNNSSDDIDGE